MHRGSGKTTWVKKQLKGDTDRYVSRDEIRFSLLQDGDEYFAHETEVFKMFVDKIVQNLNDVNSYRIFADASHLNYQSRIKLLNALKEREVDFNAVDINYIWMFTTLETCIARNALRTGRANVPESIIKEMYSRQSEPEINEGVKRVYIVNEHRKCIDIKFIDAKDSNNFEY